MADVTLDEMEAEFNEEEQTNDGQSAAPQPDPSIPEQYRNKTMSEIVSELEANRRALEISENARKNAANQSAQPAAPAAPARPPRKTDDELAELMSENPVVAMKLITQYAREDAEEHVERRLSGLQAGTMSSAEQQARTTYTTEFELFGDEIKSFVSQLPDKSVLSSPQGWEEVVSYIRGRPNNINKYIEKVTAPNREAAANDARGAQAAAAGATFSGRGASAANSTPSASNGVAARSATQLDDVERQIGQEFVNAGTFKSLDEYARSLSPR